MLEIQIRCGWIRRKICYIGHRRWLRENHPFRFDDVGFDRNVELGHAPKPYSGADVLLQLQGSRFSYGKGETQNVDIDEKDEEQIWKKRSIFLICLTRRIILFAIIWM